MSKAVAATASEKPRETPPEVPPNTLDSEGRIEVRGAPGILAQELGIIGALWWRDLLRLRKERSRWLGVVAQPLLFWIILGTGMAGTFSLPGRPDVDYMAYFFPGVLVMIVLFTTIFATIGVIEDRRSGFLQSVLVAPGTRLSLVLGKTAGVTTLAVMQSALILLVAPLAGYSLAAVDWLALGVVVVLMAVGLTAANFIVAWRLSSIQGYHALMSVILIPLWMISGALFPPGDDWLGAVAAANPMTYMVEGVRAALGGATLAAGQPGLTGCIAILLGFAALGLALAGWVTRRR